MADENRLKFIAIVFTAAFIIYTFFIAFHADIYAVQAKDMITAGNYPQALLNYFIGQPLYLLIVIGLFLIPDHRLWWQNLIGGLLIIEAGDIVSVPHCLTQAQTAILNTQNFLCSDTIFVQWIIDKLHVAYSTAWTLYYVVIPIVLILAALEILGFTAFGKKVVEMSRGQ